MWVKKDLPFPWTWERGCFLASNGAVIGEGRVYETANALHDRTLHLERIISDIGVKHRERAKGAYECKCAACIEARAMAGQTGEPAAQPNAVPAPHED